MKHPQGYGSDFCSQETRAKIAAAQSGEKAYQWRGSDVGCSGVHKRARKSLPWVCALADGTCSGQLEVALRRDAEGPFSQDKRGVFSTHVEDYWRLCRSHHNRYDGKVPPEATWFGPGRVPRGALAT